MKKDREVRDRKTKHSLFFHVFLPSQNQSKICAAFFAIDKLSYKDTGVSFAVLKQRSEKRKEESNE
jgi:hypothetical protein